MPKKYSGIQPVGHRLAEEVARETDSQTFYEDDGQISDYSIRGSEHPLGEIATMALAAGTVFALGYKVIQKMTKER